MVEKRVPASERSSRIKQQNIYENADAAARKTKICCTIGPDSSVEKLVKMLDAGMNIASLNFAGSDHKTHLKNMENIREALKQREGATCAIMLDTKGPEMKTCALRESKPVSLEKGQELFVTIDPAIEGDNTKVAVNYKQLCETVIVGSPIYIDDGGLILEVTEILDNGVKAIVQNDFVLGERKSMTLPGAIVDLPSITDKDEVDLVEFGMKNGVDIVAASFIRKAEDIENVRALLGEPGKSVKVFAKVENREALSNYDEIVAAADGVIICRVALAQEIPAEKMFIAQKYMIEKANLASKPVLIYGNLISSMVSEDTPSRSESQDIAIAVLDGADCLMVNEETASGEHSLATVQMLSKICAEAERCMDYKRALAYTNQFTKRPSPLEALASNAAAQVLDSQIDLIIVHTETGLMAQVMAKYKPSVPILAVSSCSSPWERVVSQLGVSRGITAYKIGQFNGFDQLAMQAIAQAKTLGLCKQGRKVIFIHGDVSGEFPEPPDADPRLKLIDVQ